ncbi:hypothetical protein [Helicobacter apodemus]|uniref:Bacteriocin n=1 Tax=Helicobacter apodemus TaxID=135569 RepID=A0A2U8FE37_9HELI|nr:hypothetical protein [Helicobacter apodemus]AWI34396.1 hypothetical protein CDV25_06205 [Helicobacter apodemus]
MFKKVLSILVLGSLPLSLALAQEDVLALVSKGKVTSNSVGVTKLNIEEKKQVKGGYVFNPAVTLYRYGTGSSSITQVGIVAELSKQELRDKAICGYNYSSNCGGYMDKQRYNEYMAVADYNNNERIVATLTKTTTPSFFGPRLNFIKGGMVARISNGRFYKVRSLSAYHSIVSEVYSLKKNELAIKAMAR